MIPTPTGRARARSARARAHPRMSSLAGLWLVMLLLVLRCCSSWCSCSCSSSSPLLLRLLLRLQCSTLSRLTRFPFHDSQVYFWRPFSLKVAPGSLSVLSWLRFAASWAILGGSRRPTGSQEASGALRDRFWEAFWLNNCCFLMVIHMFFGIRFLMNFRVVC